MNYTNEVWKAIPGYEGLYMVSDHGRVKSLLFGQEKILKQQDNGKGYLRVKLSKEKKASTLRVHRLVLTAFVGPCPEGMETLHGKGGTKDNRLSNLRWGTKLQNHQDRRADGNTPVGVKNVKAKLNEEKVLTIRRLRNQLGWKCQDIAEQFNIHFTVVSQISNYKTWSHI